MEDAPQRSGLRRPVLAALLVVLMAALLTLALALPRLERLFLARAAEDGQATLSLTLGALRSQLDRAAPLPRLLAERPILAQVLAEPENEGLLPFANEQLRQTALTLDVSDIYLMDPDGLTIAASNYRGEASFVGQNFAYRPYFQDAMAGGPARFHALGTTSGERGYFFAAPVLDDTQIAGVVVVKITLEGLEEAWAEADAHVLVADSNNVVFLSDRTDWHFRTIGALTPAARATIARTRQYPMDRLTPLQVTPEVARDVTEPVAIGPGTNAEEFVASRGLIASAGWRVSVLVPTGPALAQARQAVALVVLAVLIAGLIFILFVQRRARLLDRFEDQRRARETLEQRVAERTEALRQEVEERTAAEARLRRTQTELVQAGKLAALGQMSAALSHEFNQPLAAVKTYADNAQTFLDRGEPDEARNNVRLISAMADRMASISKHLRNFARRPQDKTGPIPLLATIDDAIGLMRPRLDSAGATLDFDRPGAEISVIGGRVRLQQVIVNLISNALDATQNQADRRLHLTVTPKDGGWRVALRDHGPGLGADVEAQVFDPFFSTKEPGKGMGLGLSISYNIIKDFGGSLSAENHPEGGAVFSADLKAADTAEMAAE